MCEKSPSVSCFLSRAVACLQVSEDYVISVSFCWEQVVIFCNDRVVIGWLVVVKAVK